jgi:hypothetical protein
MIRQRLVAAILCGTALLNVLGLNARLRAADKPKPTSGVISGIVIDKSDKGEKSITVRPDGADEPVKYVYADNLDAKSLDALNKTIFTVGRVRLNFKMDGETSKLVSIEKVVGQQTGVVYGQVLFTHDWWLELKPTNGGPPEGYACTYPKEKWEQTQTQIKALSKGDVVGIKFVTDGERHRIVQLEKKPTK